MILKFSMGHGPTKNLQKYEFFLLNLKNVLKNLDRQPNDFKKIKQDDPALRVFERKPGWRFTARLRVPATFREKRHLKLKVRHKSDYGLTYVMEIPLEYHIMLRTDVLRGPDDKDFEIFYGTRTNKKCSKI